MTVFETPIFWQSVVCAVGGYLFSWFLASSFGVARDLLNGAGLPPAS